VVQGGTYEPRYPSASAFEFSGGPPPSRRQRAIDAARGRVGLPRLYAPRTYAPVARTLQAAAPGIVVAHNGPALPQLLAGSDHRIILYAHNDLFRSTSPREASRIVEACDLVIGVSRYLRDTLAAKVPLRLHDRFRVVCNGVDVHRFTPAPTPRTRNLLRVAFVGRIIPDKGPDVLVRAAAMLQRDDTEFLIVGSSGFDRGGALSSYEESLRSLGESVPHLAFVPFVDRNTLPDLLRSADLLVAPGRWPEPWALTIGEGLATGLPVVATRVGGVAEQLAGAGVLVDPDDAPALAREIATLLDSPDRRERLGRAGRDLALRHDWTWAWEAFETAVRDMAGKG
jgi:glycosyltransferase involved in cell wall biosynthesis